MKRIHLFEFEDFHWFPNWIRECMTRYIQVLHRLLDTATAIAPLVERGLAMAPNQTVIDLCSGAGGPMIDVVRKLRASVGHVNVHLILTDLYPNRAAMIEMEKASVDGISYHAAPVDASDVPEELVGMRTMVCSLHHMKPDIVRRILADAARKRQPFLAFELGDNSPPIWLWWLAIPIGFLLSLFLTPRIRPLPFHQIVFTYLIPVVPLFLAWDGAVSNARTYSQRDLEELLSPMDFPSFTWEVGAIKNPKLPGSMTYILGLPISS